MAMPKVLVLTGYGINCDEETKFAFEKAGAAAELVHINDLIDKRKKLGNYRILAFPGGFSYGDDTGAGNALANRIRNHLWDELEKFVEADNLAIGICNGFQVMANLGLLPALDGSYGGRQMALVHNDSARYLDRWVDLKFKGKSPWVKGIEKISLPIAHGEGKFYADSEILGRIIDKGLVAAQYVGGEICSYQSLPANPNGSLHDIAGITDESGRIFGLMPHPERAMEFTQLPNWPLLKEKARREGKGTPKEGEGIKIFRNAVGYFR
ncbi:MAG: phosphoribosylformylglycinamidine synthase subunit PurQ [Candidatus Diapherotrites archaeon]|nr:phosphoribosylformylglycinamidine synthase subunit PurQ [Candidatus Diapherotrites archaeon]